MTATNSTWLNFLPDEARVSIPPQAEQEPALPGQIRGPVLHGMNVVPGGGEASVSLPVFGSVVIQRFGFHSSVSSPHHRGSLWTAYMLAET